MLQFDPRFEHPGRTWASATYRAFTFACVGAAMANATHDFVAKKAAKAMQRVLGIKNEDKRWKLNDDARFNP